ncbi:MAG: hypothetical protein AMJ67_00565 [Betaproteobacteria bacterium SG8_41]|nr:MAG: hypothetical protein AMJ67_00565 [Betaproteobacteria bacterium SG8_41]
MGGARRADAVRMANDRLRLAPQTKARGRGGCAVSLFARVRPSRRAGGWADAVFLRRLTCGKWRRQETFFCPSEALSGHLLEMILRFFR